MANSDPPKSAVPAPPATATATATATAPTKQQPESPPSEFHNPLIHSVALVVTPIALGALFLPPRRLDARQLLLGGVALWGTNQLVSDYSGRSFVQRFDSRMRALTGTELPEKAVRTQELLRRERAERARRLRAQEGDAAAQEELRRLEEKHGRFGQEAAALGLMEEDAREAARREGEREREGGKEKEGRRKEERGILEALWMGDQDDDWKEKRDRREKEALQDGGSGYWGLITDQISDVWNSARKKEQEAQAAETRAKAEAEVQRGADEQGTKKT